ncbi:1-deoxy-D-xylulose-5-phosphate synthase [uncultured Muribaculum sp.]|uniref:1-deoxy-D-xylulose-5-phosphate synthase n=1 Tax=uncultured Muribaculum sp. TaxID=1918613 RepID=UPI0026771604|nr:1-deoxy-D-xylulose-5-phosphate synthase [uncultured Muribaculum sp.]
MTTSFRNNYPILETIDSPEDLRKLDVPQLTGLCSELRQFLIMNLSSNPGHFASNMGAVELTVGLHYVFNTPYDRIVWDVGHQAYVHKILTGRRQKFHTNRKLNGISGFPNPEESMYDTFTAGHASNSISAALGMAMASQIKGENPRRNVVAVIGDASISGGLAFEGINNAASNRNNLLIILNDNDMSIDRNTGALSSYLAHLNTTKAYNRFRYKTYKLLKRLHLVSDRQKGFIMRCNNSIKSLLARQQNIFEGLNIRYFGPIDGHDIDRIVRVLSDIKDMDGPKILHLKTRKGKGFAPAETDPATWHAPGKFNPQTGERQAENTTTGSPAKYQDVFGHTLKELAETNKRIVGITAAMSSGTSIDIIQQSMPDRVFDVGISEGHAVTFAGGLAKDGLLPYVAIYSSFLQRAYDHIIHDVAIQRLPVTFCIDRAGLVGEDGVTHHGVYDMAYMRTIPNMTVAAPRNEHWLRNLMFTSSKKASGPIAIRYPRGKGELPEWKNEMHEIEIGKGECLVEGDRVAVLAVGTIVSQALKAVEKAKSEYGINAALYDMVFIKPLDNELLHDIAKKNCVIITVEDGVKRGGLGSAVMEWLAAHEYKRIVRTIGIPDQFITHGTVAELHKICGMDAESICNAIVDASKPKNYYINDFNK